MKLKILFLFITAMIISNVCFAHSPVRVSDYGSDGFYYRFNEIAQAMGKSNMIIQKMPQNVLSNDNYDTYLCANGPSGHGTAISQSIAVDKPKLFIASVVGHCKTSNARIRH